MCSMAFSALSVVCSVAVRVAAVVAGVAMVAEVMVTTSNLPANVVPPTAATIANSNLSVTSNLRCAISNRSSSAVRKFTAAATATATEVAVERFGIRSVEAPDSAATVAATAVVVATKVAVTTVVVAATAAVGITITTAVAATCQTKGARGSFDSPVREGAILFRTGFFYFSSQEK